MVIHVNKELANLFTWFCANKLQLNTSKSKFMIFRPSNRATNMLRSDIMINNEKIDQIGNNCNDKSFKFLGVHLDENLTWNCHISHIHNKISQSLFVINRVKNFLPITALHNLYHSLIHSHINYGLQLWGNSLHINKITILQKRAIRTICLKTYRSHTEPLFKASNILKVEHLYVAQTALLMYDFHNRLLPTSFTNFQIAKSSRTNMVTRQATQMLTDRARTNFTSRLPKHSFPSIWNTMEPTLKLSKSRNIFKKSVKYNIIQNYKNNIQCNNPMCTECGNRQLADSI